ncbi:DNA polymerase III subunit chi [Ferrimonas aestuarii]|uniref:DNA polymerase III subunit chi n=1 Tax=Ferrimonas aestuarii TaxID=2569539 RepID=A0A4U1BKN5_9GAMM|nr:DNA polymerase III subunit chi [Ferrimonas aestuarii]TKB53055.1 DNA polymerase III subunit chi [Ferrimonas aestuarii]
MAIATFYLLTDDRQQQLACWLASECYRKGQQLYLHCEDEAQAHQVDELLWQFDPERFVPHNLVGEGPRGGAPVEIGYGNQSSSKKRLVLINLAAKVPNFAVNFGQIFDFVPVATEAKTVARERYRAYRQLGIELATHDLAKQPLSF